MSKFTQVTLTMDLSQALTVANRAMLAYCDRSLRNVETMIIRSSQENKAYDKITSSILILERD
ncbi:MAG: hypothetical protein AAF383_21295 [Cyanobacteria bacterium P01_A01_bin.83]